MPPGPIRLDQETMIAADSEQSAKIIILGPFPFATRAGLPLIFPKERAYRLHCVNGKIRARKQTPSRVSPGNNGPTKVKQMFPTELRELQTHSQKLSSHIITVFIFHSKFYKHLIIGRMPRVQILPNSSSIPGKFDRDILKINGIWTKGHLLTLHYNRYKNLRWQMYEMLSSYNSTNMRERKRLQL